MAEKSDDTGQCTDELAVHSDDAPDFCRGTLERDRVYESLSHVRRRYLCYLLCERSELQVDEAVAAIAGWEHESPGEPDRERIRLSLLHSHIPKLRANDVVDFDPRSETLVTDDAEAVLSALEAVGTTLCPGSTTADGENDAA